MSEELPELEELKQRLGLTSGESKRRVKITSEDIKQSFTVEELSKAVGVDVRSILRRVDFYTKKDLFENYLLTTLKVRDILGEGGGQPLYSGLELYPEDLGVGDSESYGDIKAVIGNVTTISDGKNRALIVLVRFESGGELLDETVVTGKSSEDVRAAIRTIMVRLARRAQREEEAGES